MLSRLFESMAWRRGPCRRSGHEWTEMANPPACTRCGMTRSAVVAAQ
jgi:hypothetical protein